VNKNLRKLILTRKMMLKKFARTLLTKTEKNSAPRANSLLLSQNLIISDHSIINKAYITLAWRGLPNMTKHTNYYQSNQNYNYNQQSHWKNDSSQH